LHRGEANREQRRVLAPSVGIEVMQEIGSERSRQHCCGYATDREQTEGLRKVVYLPTELTVAFGYGSVLLSQLCSGPDFTQTRAEGFLKDLQRVKQVTCSMR
jgi:hypothetical protein